MRRAAAARHAANQDACELLQSRVAVDVRPSLDRDRSPVGAIGLVPLTVGRVSRLSRSSGRGMVALVPTQATLTVGGGTAAVPVAACARSHAVTHCKCDAAAVCTTCHKTAVGRQPERACGATANTVAGRRGRAREPAAARRRGSPVGPGRATRLQFIMQAYSEYSEYFVSDSV